MPQLMQWTNSQCEVSFLHCNNLFKTFFFSSICMHIAKATAKKKKSYSVYSKRFLFFNSLFNFLCPYPCVVWWLLSYWKLKQACRSQLFTKVTSGSRARLSWISGFTGDVQQGAKRAKMFPWAHTKMEKPILLLQLSLVSPELGLSRQFARGLTESSKLPSPELLCARKEKEQPTWAQGSLYWSSYTQCFV